MLDEALRAHNWPVIRLWCGDRREPGKLPLRQMQTARINRDDSELPDQRRQLAREFFTQATGGRGNG